MTQKRTILLIIISLALFLLAFTPHYDYSFPRHIDEWHHIEQGLKIGTNLGKQMDFEYGFHLILSALSKLVDLVLIYKFLPALWAVLSALVLFYITKKLTNNFKIGILAMIFFALIRSNVNLGGLWFFTPLTFSIPFIFLYIYYFTQGICLQNKKYILLSLAIMAFLIPIHSISVLFAIPFLTIFALINYKYLLKEYKLFSLFALIPLIGIFFYKIFVHVPYSQIVFSITNALKFRYGWGILELNNPPTQIYSLMAMFLAILGAIFIFIFVKDKEKFIPYLLWPVSVGLMLLIYLATKISFLSPYQRNVYYFVLSLPFLSAIGLHYSIEVIKNLISKIAISEVAREKIKKTMEVFIIILVIILASRNYFNIPNNIALYKIIDTDTYQLLAYLKNLPKGNVIALPNTAMATYAISQHQPIAGAHFNGNPQILVDFYNSKDCATKNTIIKNYNVKYIISELPIDCSWNKLYDKAGHYLYKK